MSMPWCAEAALVGRSGKAAGRDNTRTDSEGQVSWEQCSDRRNRKCKKP